MEMTYDGTLVMPSSYVIMEQDEMSYVEGGNPIAVIGCIAACVGTYTAYQLGAYAMGTHVADALYDNGYIKNQKDWNKYKSYIWAWGSVNILTGQGSFVLGVDNEIHNRFRNG